jgi:glycosyltransferase 2 family protein
MPTPCDPQGPGLENSLPTAMSDANALRPARSPIWRRAVGMIALAILLVFVGSALWDRLEKVDWASLQIRWGVLLAAFATQGVGMFVWAWSFHALLRHLARPPRPATTFAAAWLARLGKYVPGKVASVLGVVWLLRPYGVPSAALLATSVLQQTLWMVLGLLASLPLTLWEPVRSVFPMAWLGCVFVGAAGLVALHPRVFLAVANWLLRRLRIEPLSVRWGVRPYAAPAISVLAGIFLAGLGLWLMARAIIPIEIESLPLCVAASALSAISGYLVLFAPAGLGVREGVLLVVLSPIVGPSSAALVAVISRLVQTLVEAFFGGIGALVLWRQRSGAGSGREDQNTR